MTFRSDRDALEMKAAALQQQIESSQAEVRALKASRRGIWADRLGRVTAIAASFGGAATLVAALLWSATQVDCSAAPIGAGVVTDRYHQPAYTSHGVICHHIGKVNICTPTSTHHAARFWVRIAHDGHDREADVGQAQWERITLGQWLCVEEPCGDAVQVETFHHDDEDDTSGAS